MTRQWSTYQRAIFDHVADARNGNLIVKAVAGSGKTTTIVEATKRVKGTVLFLAFNKAIQTELKARGVNARTFHSMCMPVLNHRRQTEVTTDKLKVITAEAVAAGAITLDTAKMYGPFAMKLVGLARQAGLGTHLAVDEPSAWYDLVEHHNLTLESELADMDTAVDYARNLLATSNRDARVDFDDLLYIAVRENVSLPKYDVIFVDEAQDTNLIQRELLRKVMRNAQARIIAVGDPAQAIYGFRGADSQSLANIADEFDAITLPLSVSYRCGQRIVKEARLYVPHIEPAATAEQGTVEYFTADEFSPSLTRAGDLVVCRNNKPIIEMAYKMLMAHRPVYIMGKDIGDNLITLIERQRAKGIDQLQLKLRAYKDREVTKLRAAGSDQAADALTDKVDAILVVTEGLPETQRTVPALVHIIKILFEKKADAVIMASIHKSKGLEADRVFWLNCDYVSGYATQPWQQEQEDNLRYVAITRAKSYLGCVGQPVKKEGGY